MAAVVNNLALLVHHVVVVEDVLTHLKVARFDLLLRPFNGLGNHAVLYDFALFCAELVHDRGYAIRAE